MKLIPYEHTEHGTYYMYNHQRCRCDQCKQANSLYRKQLIIKLRQTKPIKHGTTNTYNVYKCRCNECVEAMKKSHQSRRAK